MVNASMTFLKMEENIFGVSASEVWIAMALCPFCAILRALVIIWETGIWSSEIQQKLMTQKNKD